MAKQLVQVALTGPEYDAVRAMATRRSTSISEVVRRCILTQKKVDELAQEEGLVIGKRSDNGVTPLGPVSTVVSAFL